MQMTTSTWIYRYSM